MKIFIKIQLASTRSGVGRGGAMPLPVNQALRFGNTTGQGWKRDRLQQEQLIGLSPSCTSAMK